MQLVNRPLMNCPLMFYSMCNQETPFGIKRIAIVEICSCLGIFTKPYWNIWGKVMGLDFGK